MVAVGNPFALSLRYFRYYASETLIYLCRCNDLKISFVCRVWFKLVSKL